MKSAQGWVPARVRSPLFGAIGSPVEKWYFLCADILQESPVKGPGNMQTAGGKARAPNRRREMKRDPRALAAAGAVSLTLLAANAAFAQKQGGI